jgi:enoyl-[acyl-carrier protein] reductase II
MPPRIYVKNPQSLESDFTVIKEGNFNYVEIETVKTDDDFVTWAKAKLGTSGLDAKYEPVYKAAGVDGLVVEGGEGGGFKNPSPVSSMVLLPLIRSQCDVPIIAAGGIADGPSMAAAFALGAEGVQMGTRMLSCAESPVHNNWKEAIVNCRETDTVFLNQQGRPALRALKTELTAGLEPLGKFNIMEHMANLQALYFGGDMEAAIPLQGQVGGRIDRVLSAEEIIDETMAGFNAAIDNLYRQYGQ